MRNDIKKLANYAVVLYKKDKYTIILVKSDKYRTIIAGDDVTRIKDIHNKICCVLYFPIIKNEELMLASYTLDFLNNENRLIALKYNKDASKTKEFIEAVFSKEEDKEKALDFLDKNVIKEYYDFLISCIEKDYQPIETKILENYADKELDIID